MVGEGGGVALHHQAWLVVDAAGAVEAADIGRAARVVGLTYHIDLRFKLLYEAVSRDVAV